MIEPQKPRKQSADFYNQAEAAQVICMRVMEGGKPKIRR
jgi:hypothetical protein